MTAPILKASLDYKCTRASRERFYEEYSSESLGLVEQRHFGTKSLRLLGKSAGMR
jgi:hypothetical protein